jgi:hypothetical protein
MKKMVSDLNILMPPAQDFKGSGIESFLLMRIGYKTKYQMIKDNEKARISRLSHTGMPE